MATSWKIQEYLLCKGYRNTYLDRRHFMRDGSSTQKVATLSNPGLPGPPKARSAEKNTSAKKDTLHRSHISASVLSPCQRMLLQVPLTSYNSSPSGTMMENSTESWQPRAKPRDSIKAQWSTHSKTSAVSQSKTLKTPAQSAKTVAKLVTKIDSDRNSN